MKILYFTGTGNSLYVAKQLGGELLSIPKMLKRNQLTFEDDKIGLVFPCYGASTPEIVLEFISKATLKSPYIFVVMTCGGMNANSLGHFVKYARNHGIDIKYSNRILMVYNFLPLYNVEKEKKKDKRIDESLKDIVSDISVDKEYHYCGSIIDPLITKVAQIGMKVLPSMHSPKQFKLNSDCNGCEMCVKVCPRDNITLKEVNGNLRPVFGDNCEYCLACVNLCPQKAIKVKFERNSNGRYLNENISLKEIVDSNC